MENKEWEAAKQKVAEKYGYDSYGELNHAARNFEVKGFDWNNQPGAKRILTEAALLFQQSNIDRIKELEGIIINDTKSLVSYQLRIKELEDDAKRLRFMIDNGLGWDDVKNDRW